ncbi:4Fe-4S dicluster domain-containing protein [Oleidesulfovibrio sp.]|uniref:4Fe-4S dicluster domain-containing protein n=1 Tax=Oleidesulfovibrio sp. TaxID=2909707 RepID=UPI003A8891E5
MQLSNFIVADTKKCIGCRLCEVACSVAHSRMKKEPVAGNLTEPLLPRLYLVRTAQVTAPVQCRHCEDAPCAGSCPVHAIRRADGALVVDEVLCVGCKTCMLACPFGAIELLPVFENGKPKMQAVSAEDESGRMEETQVLVAGKCDLCTGRQAGPACVEVCPKQALALVSAKTLRQQRSSQAAHNLAKYVSGIGSQQSERQG